MRIRISAVTVALTLTVFLGSAAAEDHFLTIGGGYSPTGNQVSLEKNVLLYQKLLAEEYPGGAQHDIYFADGDDDGRDLQFKGPQKDIPRANLQLARVLRQTKYLGYQYRSHEVGDIRGASSRDNIAKWFDANAEKLQPGDRLFIYVTAHGGSSADRKQPHNTRLYLWNSQNIQVKELVRHLDKLHNDVAVVLVMVQCYSGGFANVVFNEGDAKKGFTAANRCGFYATVHNRQAAGCTPDINEENYYEYSSYFFEALRGKSRTGEPIDRPDYDGDGEVSFDEAHAYALLTSSTIDISIRTSDAYLRAFSKLKGKDHPDLLSGDSPYAELLELATPSERMVLESLSDELGFKESERAKEAKSLASKIAGEKKKMDGEIRKKGRELGMASSAIRKALINRWPEIANRWNPAVDRILQEEGGAVAKFIESHPSYARFNQLSQEMSKHTKGKLDSDKRWAKTQRVIRVLENIAYRANLPQVASEDVQKRFAELALAEQGVFGAKAGAKAEVSEKSGQ